MRSEVPSAARPLGESHEVGTITLQFRAHLAGSVGCRGRWVRSPPKRVGCALETSVSTAARSGLLPAGGRSADRRASALEQEHVAPGAVQPTEPLAAADDPETGSLMHAEARLVLREDAGLDRPDPGRLGRGDERLEQRPADAAAARLGSDVDAVLDHAAVDAAIRHRRDGDEAGDAAVHDRDEPVRSEMPLVPALPRRHLRLERRVARRDPLRVDPSDLRPVLRVQLLDHRREATEALCGRRRARLRFAAMAATRTDLFPAAVSATDGLLALALLLPQ